MTLPLALMSHRCSLASLICISDTPHSMLLLARFCYFSNYACFALVAYQHKENFAMRCLADTREILQRYCHSIRTCVYTVNDRRTIHICIYHNVFRTQLYHLCGARSGSPQLWVYNIYKKDGRELILAVSWSSFQPPNQNFILTYVHVHNMVILYWTTKQICQYSCTSSRQVYFRLAIQ